MSIKRIVQLYTHKLFWLSLILKFQFFPQSQGGNVSLDVFEIKTLQINYIQVLSIHLSPQNEQVQSSIRHAWISSSSSVSSSMSSSDVSSLLSLSKLSRTTRLSATEGASRSSRSTLVETSCASRSKRSLVSFPGYIRLPTTLGCGFPEMSPDLQVISPGEAYLESYQQGQNPTMLVHFRPESLQVLWVLIFPSVAILFKTDDKKSPTWRFESQSMLQKPIRRPLYQWEGDWQNLWQHRAEERRWWSQDRRSRPPSPKSWEWPWLWKIRIFEIKIMGMMTSIMSTAVSASFANAHFFTKSGPMPHRWEACQEADLLQSMS